MDAPNSIVETNKAQFIDGPSTCFNINKTRATIDSPPPIRWVIELMGSLNFTVDMYFHLKSKIYVVLGTIYNDIIDFILNIYKYFLMISSY